MSRIIYSVVSNGVPDISAHQLINSWKFSSLKAWKHFRKSRSLEVWKSGGLKRRLSWDFISPDFIKSLVPYCPSILVPSKAFTMAEILISLTIIGVIAAITLPSLRANINESAWATQRKALYSRMSQAISMLPSLNGYGIILNADGTVNYASTNQKAAMAFVNDGLSKVLKINNICDSTNLSKCGLPNKITVMGTNSKVNFPTKLTELNTMFTGTYDNGTNTYTNPQKDINTVTVAFETGNGESVAVFYNPICQPDMGETGTHYAQPRMCSNFIYDLNGRKGPNKVGKDIGFITALYSTDTSIVAPMPLETDSDDWLKYTLAAAYCRAHDENSRMPNKEELMAMFYNRSLIGIPYGGFFSGTVTPDNKVWGLSFNYGGLLKYDITNSSRYVRCIKR